MYWNINVTKGLIYTIRAYLPLVRYEEIKRYYYISSWEDDERLGRHLPTNKVWWYKIEPLAFNIQASYR